ncbi:hypothetical protein CGSMWGv1500E_04196 [Gardnerella vaginalis 1500E]|uniref:Uncharacterized protein n=1 Tax=Gardnerella vaginalis 1500E TaxID=698957 RepID=I4LZI8_GARVA|nr:hypothetical protein CGSMWGv1500E_04196 [Gardnerella vaginalis 1500E]
MFALCASIPLLRTAQSAVLSFFFENIALAANAVNFGCACFCIFAVVLC